MVVGYFWASCRCHSLDSRIVRDFQVDLVWQSKVHLAQRKQVDL